MGVNLKSKSCRLITMIVLTVSFFFVELIVGYVTNSLALVADSFHMLSDIIALIVGLAAVRMSKKTTDKNTYGWQRAEVLGALVNSVFLLALCFTIIVDALNRLIETEVVNNPDKVLYVGIAGLAVNGLGLVLFSSHGMGHGHSHGGGGHGHSHRRHKKENHVKSVSEDIQEPEVRDPILNEHSTEVSEYTSKASNEGIVANGGSNINGKAAYLHVQIKDEDDEDDESPSRVESQLNMKGVFLHVLGDALGSIVVIISATIIWQVKGANWTVYVDPVLSLIIVVIITSTTFPLFKQSSMILLQSIPRDIDISELQDKLLQLPGVLNVHELHIWQLAGNKYICTAHVCFKSQEDYITGVLAIKTLLHKYGVHSSTIQPEFEVENFSVSEGAFDIDSCQIVCPQSCEPQTCCGSRRSTKGNISGKQDEQKAQNEGQEAQASTEGKSDVSTEGHYATRTPEPFEHRGTAL